MAWLSSTVDSNSWKRRLFLLFATGIGARILFALVCAKAAGPLAFYRADTFQYIQPAESLLRGSFLSPGSYALSGRPEIFRTPGYPLLLAPALALRHPVVFGLAENFLLVAISMWLVWKISWELFPGGRAAFWATLLFCFEPLGFVCSTTLMSETAFTTLIVVFTWAVVRVLREPSFKNVALAALFLGCATYVRPVSLYLSFWLIPFFLVFPRRTKWRQRLRTAVLLPGIFVMAVAPWVIRNSRVAGYSGFSSAQEWNLYFMSALAVEAKLQNKNAAEMVREWGAKDTIEDYFSLHPEQRTWTNGQIAHFWGTEARKIIAAHPSTYALIHAKGCASMLFHPGVTEFLQSFGIWQRDPISLAGKLSHPITATLWLLREYPVAAILSPLLLVQIVLYYALGLVGLRYMSLEVRFLFATLCLYVVLVSGHPGVMARYRVPIIPWVVIAAGAAIAYRRTRKTARIYAAETSA